MKNKPIKSRKEFAVKICSVLQTQACEIEDWLNEKSNEGFSLREEFFSEGKIILIMNQQRRLRRIRTEPNKYQMKWKDASGEEITAELKELI